MNFSLQNISADKTFGGQNFSPDKIFGSKPDFRHFLTAEVFKILYTIRRVDGTLASGVAVPRLVVRGCTHDAYTV